MRAAPVLLAIRVFGGLEPAVVFAYTCVSLSVAVLGASLGLLETPEPLTLAELVPQFSWERMRREPWRADAATLAGLHG